MEKQNKQAWIISCNPDYYYIEDAVYNLPSIDWKQKAVLKNVKAGDDIYIYLSGKDFKFIKYKAVVLSSGKPDRTIDDSAYEVSLGTDEYEGLWMELKIVAEYEDFVLSLSELRKHGIKSGDCMTGPKKVNDELLAWLNNAEQI